MLGVFKLQTLMITTACHKPSAATWNISNPPHLLPFSWPFVLLLCLWLLPCRTQLSSVHLERRQGKQGEDVYTMAYGVGKAINMWHKRLEMAIELSLWVGLLYGMVLQTYRKKRHFRKMDQKLCHLSPQPMASHLMISAWSHPSLTFSSSYTVLLTQLSSAPFNLVKMHNHKDS